MSVEFDASRRSIVRFITGAIVAALLLAACTNGATSTTPSPSTTTSSTISPSTTASSTPSTIPDSTVIYQQPRELSPFAAYSLVPMDETGTYPGPAWPTSLDL